MKTLTQTEISAPERGALWLDEMSPGWYKRISLADFDIRDGSYCVCGQVFRNKEVYGGRAGTHLLSDGYDHVNDTIGDRVYEYGFGVKPLPHDPKFEAKWDALEAEWTEIIRQRQEQAS